MRALRAIAKERGTELVEVEGGAHTKITIGDRATVVPCHREINELTARAILRQVEEHDDEEMT